MLRSLALFFSWLTKRSIGKAGRIQMEDQMGTTAPPAPPAPPTWEQAVEQATADAAQIGGIFSPVIGGAVAAGLPVEPIIFGFISMISSLFKHHASKVSPAPTA